MGCLAGVPDRGRIIVVNFELGGGAHIPPEMKKSHRPCIVIQNNKLARGRLVTVVPLSTTAPAIRMPYHHLMDHRSFRELPTCYGEKDMPRWAKCDYVISVSLDRCVDPSHRNPYQSRKYVKVKIILADLTAIEKAVLWGLGIDPRNHVTV